MYVHDITVLMCVLRSVISYLVTRVDGTESESDSTRILDSLIAQIAGRRQISGEFLFFRKATNPLKFGLRNGANWQPEVGLCKGLRSRSAGSCSFDAINAIVLRPQSLLLRWSVVRLARSAASDGNELLRWNHPRQPGRNASANGPASA